MLLNNYYRLQCYRSMVGVNLATLSTIPEIRTADGTARTAIGGGTNMWANASLFHYPCPAVQSQATPFTINNYNVVYGNLVIGSGTTAASADDYKLESEITDVTYVSMYTKRDPTTGTITIVKTHRNESTESISVSEVGYTEPFVTGTGTGSNTAYQLLTVREVYDTPIVVAPGETFSVTLNVQFPLPA